MVTKLQTTRKFENEMKFEIVTDVKKMGVFNCTNDCYAQMTAAHQGSGNPFQFVSNCDVPFRHNEMNVRTVEESFSK
ncbi:MAG: hypothetical protein IPK68_15550 [Bdellovibrionales bacterium]|nr:hypothetical protein [Bdellovibrionales bacterium]